jgi:hypothetical protein
MDKDHDFIGKTITGIIASNPAAGHVREIWLMQFSDGTYVEFVSPKAKNSLRKAARQTIHARRQPPPDASQLALNVA